MQVSDKNMGKSEGDEVFDQLQQNADQYVMGEEGEKVLSTNQPKQQEIQLSKQSQEVKKGPISFEQIKMVYSTQESGDGHTKSVKVICPHCKKTVETQITRKAGKETYMASCVLLLCSFGLVCISCLPFIIDDCKDVYHTCPECKGNVGKTLFHILD